MTLKTYVALRRRTFRLAEAAPLLTLAKLAEQAIAAAARHVGDPAYAIVRNILMHRVGVVAGDRVVARRQRRGVRCPDGWVHIGGAEGDVRLDVMTTAAAEQRCRPHVLDVRVVEAASPVLAGQDTSRLEHVSDMATIALDGAVRVSVGAVRVTLHTSARTARVRAFRADRRLIVVVAVGAGAAGTSGGRAARRRGSARLAAG